MRDRGHPRHSGRFRHSVGRLYHQLTPSERFRLVLEASARDGEEERARLVRLCPRKTYTMTDLAFTDRCDASRDLAVAIALDLGHRVAQATMLRASRESLRRALGLGLEVVAEVGDEERPTDEEADRASEPLVAALAELEQDIKRKAAAVLVAFGEVCRSQMALKPAVVLRAHLGQLGVEQLRLDELEGVEPEEEAVDLWRERFERKWREFIEQ
jgi:hypothetical protein